MTLFDRLVRLSLPLIPRFIVGRVARRYVAGETLEQAVQTVRALNDEGAMATVDVLGEGVRDPAACAAALEEYLRLLEAIAEHKLRCNVSVKPSLMGLALDPKLAQQNVTRLAAHAAERDNFVRLDMEDHTTVEGTLALYRQLQPARGNLGVVLQSMLRRTPADIRALLAAGAEQLNVRLVKGIYREPRRVAWRAYETVRAAFGHQLRALVEGGAYVAIATHDEHLLEHALDVIGRHNLPAQRYEFQMLLGVDPELRRVLLDGGHRLRVYVPYGRDWYAYSVRRLRENPTVAKHVLRAMLGLGPK